MREPVRLEHCFRAVISAARVSLHDRGRVETPDAATSGGIRRRDHRGRRHLLNMPSRRIWRKGLSPYALIALISGPVPRILIARFKLYARTCKLISVRTRGSVLVRK